MLWIYVKKILTLTNKREGAGLKHCNGPKVFIEYPNINDIFENIGQYNLDKERKIWIVFSWFDSWYGFQ